MKMGSRGVFMTGRLEMGMMLLGLGIGNMFVLRGLCRLSLVRITGIKFVFKALSSLVGSWGRWDSLMRSVLLIIGGRVLI